MPANIGCPCDNIRGGRQQKSVTFVVPANIGCPCDNIRGGRQQKSVTFVVPTNTFLTAPSKTCTTVLTHSLIVCF